MNILVGFTQHFRKWLMDLRQCYRDGGFYYTLKAVFFRPYQEPEVLLNPDSVVFQFIKFNEEVPVIQGFVLTSALLPDQTATLWIEGPKLKIAYTQSLSRSRFYFNCNFAQANNLTEGFSFRFPVRSDLPPGTYRLQVGGNSRNYPLRIIPGRHFPVAAKYPHAYFNLGNGLRLHLKQDGAFELKSASRWGNAWAEAAFCRDLIVRFSFEEFAAVFLRIAVLAARRFRRRNLWIFSDKLGNPFDSAYAVAYALLTNPEFNDAGISARYLVSHDEPRKREIGALLPVLPYQSFRHIFCHLVADVHVTSEGGYNPLLPRIDPYRDLLGHQLRIWAGHGIIHHEMSMLYGKERQNFNLLTLGVQREREALLGELWGYDPNELALTGLPRWDFRENRPSKKIYFIFTWRNYLAVGHDLRTFLRVYDKSFSQSEFCRRLNALLSAPELRDVAREYGYELCFVPHPLLVNALPYFSIPDYVRVTRQDIRYDDIYAEASLLVTDYSSVAMDMAYLGKPVIYYQFDRERFYATQGYAPSYYSWDDDGFGEVVRTHEEAVACILEQLRNGCRRDEIYRRRAEAFFPPRDKENGARAVRAILEMAHRKNRL